MGILWWVEARCSLTGCRRLGGDSYSWEKVLLWDSGKRVAVAWEGGSGDWWRVIGSKSISFMPRRSLLVFEYGLFMSLKF